MRDGCFRLFTYCFFESSCKLIWARRAFEAAAYSLAACNNILCLHTVDKRSNALEIAVAAALKTDVTDNAVVKLKLN